MNKIVCKYRSHQKVTDKITKIHEKRKNEFEKLERETVHKKSEYFVSNKRFINLLKDVSVLQTTLP